MRASSRDRRWRRLRSVAPVGRRGTLGRGEHAGARPASRRDLPARYPTRCRYNHRIQRRGRRWKVVMKHHKPPIRILCADDHPLVREGIARKVNRQPDMKVIGTTSTGEEAVELFERHRPDIVLMDLELPGIRGTQAI